MRVNVHEAVDTITDYLKTIPDLVAALGDNADAIQGHKFRASVMSPLVKLNQMQSPCVLVAYHSTALEQRFNSSSTTWRHAFTIFVKVVSEDEDLLPQIMQAILGGKSEIGDGLPFLETMILSECDPPGASQISFEPDKDINGAPIFVITFYQQEILG